MTIESRIDKIENSVRSETELSAADRKLIDKLRQLVQELNEKVETISEKPPETASSFDKIAWELSRYQETGAFPEDFTPANLEDFLELYQTESEDDQVNRLFNLFK